jgi:ABC-type dipeptide/oligopeptide/nickel transport system permease component
VTVLGLDIGILLGGAILTESVFNIPGVGRLATTRSRGDLPIVQGTVLFGASSSHHEPRSWTSCTPSSTPVRY